MATNGITFYRGPSHLAGQGDILAIVTNTRKPSANTKTGPMAQLWILPATQHPHEAAKNGTDTHVCGICPRRPQTAAQTGETPCYVTLAHGPGAVWKARDTYPTAASRYRYPVRLGAWGDPAALPLDVLQAVIAASNGKWTGYTHAWRTRPDLQPYCMASCDTLADHAEARAAGWRTFTVLPATATAPADTIICPASKEAGQRTTCAQCNLCNGSTGPNDRRKSITIAAH